MNSSPEVYGRSDDRVFTEEDFNIEHSPYDEKEIFDHIRDIKDPEHPMSLEELGVVEMGLIQIVEEDNYNYCCVEFKPTIPHCSMATLIGLAIKVQLLRILPASFKIDVRVYPETHVSYNAINKQLADKERIAASLENQHLLQVINDCLLFSEAQTLPSFIEKALMEENKLNHEKVNYIKLSRQPIQTYRRWKDIINSKEGDILSSLSYVT